MAPLARDPKVIRLAQELGLSARGDCVEAIRNMAVDKVRQHEEDLGALVPITDLNTLLRGLANSLHAKIEMIDSDGDVERIAERWVGFHPHLAQRLREEFLEGSTEGITLARDGWMPGACRFLLVIDARGERFSRAYFTAWHEVTHLLVQPEQLEFVVLRRTPTRAEVRKDPLESVVDHIAGKLAFYQPFFEPVIRAEIERAGELTFRVVEAARDIAAPTASLLAAATASIEYARVPTALLTVEPRLKASEARARRSAQQDLGFGSPVEGGAALRVVTCISNTAAGRRTFGLHPNIRVPDGCVLSHAHSTPADLELSADEDQGWWETSQRGPLSPLPLRVCAARRGRFVYGLISTR